MDCLELLSEMIELENKDVDIMLSFVLVVYFILFLFHVKSNSFKNCSSKVNKCNKRK